MAPELKYWVQFLLATHFLLPCIIILTYLTVHCVCTWLERVTMTHTQEEEY
jgi:TRAP-type mannitol/chloroaromatic compound transport system permease small subunit